MLTCGSKRNRSTPSNFTPLTEALAVKASIVSRSMGGSESGPLPTRPGHMALWSLGSWFMGAPLDWAWSSCRSHCDVCRTVRVALVRFQHPRLAASGNQHGPRAMLRAPSLPKTPAEGKPLLLDFCRPRREPKTESRNSETQKSESAFAGVASPLPVEGGFRIARSSEWYVFSAMVGMARRALPAREVAGG